MRFFNTAGPVNCQDHYCLPPLTRFDLSDILTLISQKKYFILHAPRQSGKTSCLLALRDYLNNTDEYRSLYINVEAAQAAREDVENGMYAIIAEIMKRVEQGNVIPNPSILADAVKGNPNAFSVLNILLSKLASSSDKHLILLIDEIDSLVGDIFPQQSYCVGFGTSVITGYIQRKKMVSSPEGVHLISRQNRYDWGISQKKKQECSSLNTQERPGRNLRKMQ